MVQEIDANSGGYSGTHITDPFNPQSIGSGWNLNQFTKKPMSYVQTSDSSLIALLILGIGIIGAQKVLKVV